MNVDTSESLVSVYIPTKNRLELLKLAVASVLSQDYPYIEIIVVDDGSTDDTYQWLTQQEKNLPNFSFYHFEKSQGACAARNLAIEKASGKFVTGLDDDDLFLSNRISSLIDQYDDEYSFVCSGCIWDFGKRQRLDDHTQLDIRLEDQLSYNEATTQVLVERARILNVGGFDTQLSACQDYDLWTRLIIHYGNAKRISGATYILNDTGSSERMVYSEGGAVGFEQFYAKHEHLMNNDNRVNQQFLQLRRCRKPLSFRLLIQQIGVGYFPSKLRYFLSSNFSFIKNAHRWFYRAK